jgi:hypothetical protein
MAGLAVCAMACAPAAQATPVNLVTNGTFVDTGDVLNGVGTNITGSNLTGWTLGACQTFNCASGQPPFVFLALPNYVNAGVDYGSTNIPFWGGTANPGVTPGGAGATPGGVNAIAVDATNIPAAISQTLTNLKVGETYLVTFQQALTEFAVGNTANTANWQVTFGGKTATSTTMSAPAKGSSTWGAISMYFTADATSDVLSFFATADNGADPPVVLLSNVSVVDAPEPASMALLAAGLAGMVFMRRKSLRA